MTASPRVTVAIPTYNHAEFLGGAIESVRQQTFEDLEILVLDNASTDDTPEIVRRHACDRLRYVRNPRNLGYNGNQNRALEVARGELIVYIGADDLLEPPFLEKAVACLDGDPGLSFVHGAALWIDGQGLPFGDSGNGWAPVMPGPEAFLCCLRHGFCLSTMLMRSALVRRAGGLDPRWGDIADGFLFLRLCLAGRVGYLSDPLVRYRVHDRTLTAAFYRDGSGFGRHLSLVRAAFELPEARALGLGRKQRAGLRAVVAEYVRMAHVTRIGGTRGAFLASLLRLVGETPELWLAPSTWARLGLGMLPAPWILALRHRKRRRWTGSSPGRR